MKIKQTLSVLHVLFLCVNVNIISAFDDTSSSIATTTLAIYTTSPILNGLLTTTTTTIDTTTTVKRAATTTTRAFTVITCKTNADCPVTLSCVVRVCLLVQAIITTKSVTTQVTEAHSDYSPLNEVIVNPLLWTLIIGLPLIIIIVIVIVLVIYCRHSCRITRAFSRRRARHVAPPNIALERSSRRNSQVFLDETMNSVDTQPPMYKDVTNPNPNGGNNNNSEEAEVEYIENKDLFNISIEQLPTYSSWSKKHQPSVEY